MAQSWVQFPPTAHFAYKECLLLLVVWTLKKARVPWNKFNNWGARSRSSATQAKHDLHMNLNQKKQWTVTNKLRMSKHTLMLLFMHYAHYMGTAHAVPMYHDKQPETQNETRRYAYIKYLHEVSGRFLEKNLARTNELSTFFSKLEKCRKLGEKQKTETNSERKS